MTSTRREFVAMLLGAPALAALGCGRRGARTLDGTLLDTGMARGHAVVRDAAPPVVPDDRWRRSRVVVVGGGVAGLTAAWWLDRGGVRDVTLLELDDVAGGTARGDTSAVTPYPWGAHYVVAPQRHQREMLALLGDLAMLEDETTVAEQFRCRELEERVFYHGRWYEGLYLHAGARPDDRAQLQQFLAEIDRWVAWRDGAGRRAFTLPTSACSDDDEVTALDHVSMAGWLDAHGLTSPRLRWLVDYGCRDDYGLSADDASAWAGLLYFASRMDAPGAEAQSVVTWPDGNGALTSALAARLGPRLITGAVVVDVTPRADGTVAVTTLGADGPAGWIADQVVVATPRHVARRIVAPLRGSPAGAWQPDVGAWAVANLHLRARPASHRHSAPPAWDNVLYDSPSLGYVTATHQRGRDHGPTVLTWYYPLLDDAIAARTRVAGAGHAEWAEAAVTDLSRAHRDLPGLIERVDVALWGHGMPRPRVGATWRPERRDAARAIGAIHFAHTDLSGLALFEEALDHGVRAAREVLAALLP